MQNLQAKVRLRSEGSLSDPSVFFFFLLLHPRTSPPLMTRGLCSLVPADRCEKGSAFCSQERAEVGQSRRQSHARREKQKVSVCVCGVWETASVSPVRIKSQLSLLSFLIFFFSFLMFSFSFFLTYHLSCLRSHLLTLSFLIFLFLPYLCSFLLIFYLLLALFFISYFVSSLALFLSCLVSRLFFLIYLFSFFLYLFTFLFSFFRSFLFSFFLSFFFFFYFLSLFVVLSPWSFLPSLLA